MTFEYGPSDLQPHLIRGLFPVLLDWSTATGLQTILEGGVHPKMRLRTALVMNCGAACNAIEPVITISHGGNEVVASADMATILSATAAIGEIAALTILDRYKDLEAEDSLEINVTTVDAGSASRGLILFDYEVVE